MNSRDYFAIHSSIHLLSAAVPAALQTSSAFFFFLHSSTALFAIGPQVFSQPTRLGSGACTEEPPQLKRKTERNAVATIIFFIDILLDTYYSLRRILIQSFFSQDLFSGIRTESNYFEISFPDWLIEKTVAPSVMISVCSPTFRKRQPIQT